MTDSGRQILLAARKQKRPQHCFLHNDFLSPSKWDRDSADLVGLEPGEAILPAFPGSATPSIVRHVSPTTR